MLALCAVSGELPKLPRAMNSVTLVAKRVRPLPTVSIDRPASGQSRSALSTQCKTGYSQRIETDILAAS